MRAGKRADRPRIEIEGGGAILYAGALDDIDIPKAVVVAQSIRFFDDPAPCMIHQAAVRAAGGNPPVCACLRGAGRCAGRRRQRGAVLF